MIKSFIAGALLLLSSVASAWDVGEMMQFPGGVICTDRDEALIMWDLVAIQGKEFNEVKELMDGTKCGQINTPSGIVVEVVSQGEFVNGYAARLLLFVNPNFPLPFYMIIMNATLPEPKEA